MIKSLPVNGKKIKDLRYALGIKTQPDLCEIINRKHKKEVIELRTVQYAEAGKCISPTMIQYLAEVLLPNKEKWKELVDLDENTHDVEKYEIKISFLSTTKENHTVTHGGKSTAIECDNVAEISYSILFTQYNWCLKPFNRRYSTRNNGRINQKKINFTNLLTPLEQWRYDDHAQEVNFRFTPEIGKRKTFEMKFDVYDGFDKNNRNAHFHLTQPAFYRHVYIVLNLEQYLCNFTLKQEPIFYFHDHDLMDHNLCKYRDGGRIIKPKVGGVGGQWEWQVDDVREGVVDLIWDLE